MDEIVRQAIAKWPNVPHCYGWLALDARGAWRMLDERAQALRLPGDKIIHPALLGFINRNYMHDEAGRWYFQNGPQRVYVNLEVAPFVARTDPRHGFVLHTEEPLPVIDDVWLTGTGQVILASGEKAALMDDRDTAQLIEHFHTGGKPVGDEELMRWLAGDPAEISLTFIHSNRHIPVHRIAADAIAAHFGFIKTPQPDNAGK